MNQPIYSVSQVNNYIKSLLERDNALYHIWIRGEISNCKIHYTGHIYLTLKDEKCAMRAVMFRGDAQNLAFVPQDGMKVVAMGRVSVFERDGVYQLYINDMQPDGVGALHIAYEQLKEKLAAEGLFEERYKKPLPLFPKTIGVVTAATGAAVRDIIHILNRRYPQGKVCVYPVLVQGEGAPSQIVEAIEALNRNRAVDVLIVGRGGGSIEDLWAFNNEAVARAVFHSEIPIVSAVGHETDFTIIDFVADLRAPTPSAAAELVSPNRSELFERSMELSQRLVRAYQASVSNKRAKIEALAASRVFSNPLEIVNNQRQYLDTRLDALKKAMELIVYKKKQAFETVSVRLEAYSPLGVLRRGYAIALDDNKKVVRSVHALKEGDTLTVRLADGTANCAVTGKEEEHE